MSIVNRYFLVICLTTLIISAPNLSSSKERFKTAEELALAYSKCRGIVVPVAKIEGKSRAHQRKLNAQIIDELTAISKLNGTPKLEKLIVARTNGTKEFQQLAEDMEQNPSENTINSFANFSEKCSEVNLMIRAGDLFDLSSQSE